MSPHIATADRVDRDALLGFVRPRHKGTLVTLRKDGRPQMSPVGCGVDDYRAAMVKQDKSLIRVTIERWGPIATGGFPPDRVDAG